MLQRLPIALAQVKASNTPKDFLNEICQIDIQNGYNIYKFGK